MSQNGPQNSSPFSNPCMQQIFSVHFQTLSPYFSSPRPILVKGGIDTCQGDSGGPLMVKDDTNNNWMTLVGVVSHGAGCAEPNSLGIYSKVSENIDWLYASMPDLNTCSKYSDIAEPDGENAVFCDTEYDDQ